MAALPSSPDLSFEKKRAKQLLKAARAGDSLALARMAMHLRKSPTELTLADAQFAIARERGFETWAALKAHIDAAQPIAAQMTKFLVAIRERRTAVARRILKTHPTLTALSLHVASAAGDVAQVRRHLSTGGNAIDGPGDDRMQALGYACWSTFHARGARAAADSQSVVTLLLDHGCDPNTPVSWPEAGHDVKLPVLWAATESENLGVASLLLERGAKPDDGESTYHSAQHNRVEVLKLLEANGADFSKRQEPFNNTPLYLLAGHNDDEGGDALWARGFAWLLDHGADPNVGSYTHDEVPLHKTAGSARLLAVTRLLLDHGADPNRVRADGRTPYAVALRSGNSEAMDLLRAHGADPLRVTAVDRLLGAAFRGDLADARAIAAEIGDWRSTLPLEDHDALTRAVWQNQPEALHTLVALGFSAVGKGMHGHTPLHPAAWLGRPRLVSALLDLGAATDVNVRDAEHGSSPLGWAAHGSQFCRTADNDYLAVIDLLLNAGATIDPATNRSGEKPSQLASRVVAAALKSRGL